jgi:hypothetical protein
MKYLLLLIISFYGNVLFSQTEKETIDDIRSRFKWINSQQNFITSELNNRDYLDFSPDNGASITAYYKDNSLYKVVEIMGLSYAILTTEYYLWDNQLIFVYYTEKNFKQIKDASGNFVELDYSHTETKYEGRHYFDNGKEIKTIIKGEKTGATTLVDFKKRLQEFIPLLKNKKNNQLFYQKIQGKWVSTEDPLNSIEFDGLTKTSFYEDEFLDEFKIKIDKEYLYCQLQNEEELEEYKYKIIELTDTTLRLLYLPKGTILAYKKRL